MKSPDPEIQVQNESGMTNSIRREMSLFENGGVRGYYLETAYKYLMSIPPTSVEPERAFSAAAYRQYVARDGASGRSWPQPRVRRDRLVLRLRAKRFVTNCSLNLYSLSGADGYLAISHLLTCCLFYTPVEQSSRAVVQGAH
ncbi:hypothetical protein EVAR_3374_1 [Eumeta japonica]|uniref:HAT C-terminal dimerisation domain-containing protein n=1 Tax=Eumeta variegata TaxID=151549 RepID=A0A4C1SS16_EUMVA|nr:hypothetical protein EVAR_3374_1 [Eumeta japonica]